MSEFKRFSYSMIRCYLDCPKSFEFRYLRQLPTALNGALICGRCYHHGVEYALKRKQQGQLAAAEEVRDIVSDCWEAEVGEHFVYDDPGEAKIEAKQIEWAEDDPGKLKDAVLDLACLYLQEYVPYLTPLAVEERLIGEIAGIPFVAYPDLIVGKPDGSGTGIIDHKFTTRKANQEYIDKDLQFSVYGALLGKSVWACWHQALMQRELKINVVSSTRSQDDYDWLGKVVSGVYQGINSGVFPPNPLSHFCGEGCSYYLECRVLMED